MTHLRPGLTSGQHTFRNANDPLTPPCNPLTLTLSFPLYLFSLNLFSFLTSPIHSFSLSLSFSTFSYFPFVFLSFPIPFSVLSREGKTIFLCFCYDLSLVFPCQFCLWAELCTRQHTCCATSVCVCICVCVRVCVLGGGGGGGSGGVYCTFSSLAIGVFTWFLQVDKSQVLSRLTKAPPHHTPCHLRGKSPTTTLSTLTLPT